MKFTVYCRVSGDFLVKIDWISAIHAHLLYFGGLMLQYFSQLCQNKAVKTFHCRLAPAVKNLLFLTPGCEFNSESCAKKYTVKCGKVVTAVSVCNVLNYTCT